MAMSELESFFLLVILAVLGTGIMAVWAPSSEAKRELLGRREYVRSCDNSGVGAVIGSFLGGPTGAVVGGVVGSDSRTYVENCEVYKMTRRDGRTFEWTKNCYTVTRCGEGRGR